MHHEWNYYEISLKMFPYDASCWHMPACIWCIMLVDPCCDYHYGSNPTNSQRRWKLWFRLGPWPQTHVLIISHFKTITCIISRVNLIDDFLRYKCKINMADRKSLLAHYINPFLPSIPHNCLFSSAYGCIIIAKLTTLLWQPHQILDVSFKRFTNSDIGNTILWAGSREISS